MLFLQGRRLSNADEVPHSRVRPDVHRVNAVVINHEEGHAQHLFLVQFHGSGCRSPVVCCGKAICLIVRVAPLEPVHLLLREALPDRHPACPRVLAGAGQHLLAGVCLAAESPALGRQHVRKPALQLCLKDPKLLQVRWMRPQDLQGVEIFLRALIQAVEALTAVVGLAVQEKLPASNHIESHSQQGGAEKGELHCATFLGSV
mmetsp:Transcript_40657/g.88860  ORF Transcript_40657/g.88860 Transcript_40657/m.88860 type:complete len:203 (+) Transcript_40657:120-728(+)